MQPFKIGILGAARIAPKAIIQPAKVMPSLQIAAVASRSLDRAKSFAQTHEIPEALDSYQALIARPDIDIVYNPLPPSGHAEWSIKALEAGKHVICEKPFAMNVDEAREMLAAAEHSGKRIIEAFHYRYHPAFNQVLSLVQAGELGQIKSVDACFNVTIAYSETELRHRIDTGGGALMDLGCYPLNWVMTLLDEAPTKINADAEMTQGGVDEKFRAHLAFASGCEANIETDMSPGTPFKAELTIHGSEGTLVFENPLAPHNGGSISVTKDDITTNLTISRTSTYTNQLDTIAQALESGEPLPTEGITILRQQSAIDALYSEAGLKHLRWLE